MKMAMVMIIISSWAMGCASSKTVAEPSGTISPESYAAFISMWVGKYQGVGDFYEQVRVVKSVPVSGSGFWRRNQEIQLGIYIQGNQLLIMPEINDGKPGVRPQIGYTFDITEELFRNSNEISGSQKSLPRIVGSIGREIEFSFKKTGPKLTGRVRVVEPISTKDGVRPNRLEFIFTHLEKVEKGQ